MIDVTPPPSGLDNDSGIEATPEELASLLYELEQIEGELAELAELVDELENQVDELDRDQSKQPPSST